MKVRQRIGSVTFRLLIAPLIWFAHLNVLYGAHTVMCVHATHEYFQMLSVVATVAALIAVVAAARHLSREDDPQAIDRMSLGLAALSFLGVCWTGVASSLANLSC